jgi:hypothetical protein
MDRRTFRCCYCGLCRHSISPLSRVRSMAGSIRNRRKHSSLEESGKRRPSLLPLRIFQLPGRWGTLLRRMERACVSSGKGSAGLPPAKHAGRSETQCALQAATAIPEPARYRSAIVRQEPADTTQSVTRRSLRSQLEPIIGGDCAGCAAPDCAARKVNLAG